MHNPYQMLRSEDTSKYDTKFGLFRRFIERSAGIIVGWVLAGSMGVGLKSCSDSHDAPTIRAIIDHVGKAHKGALITAKGPIKPLGWTDVQFSIGVQVIPLEGKIKKGVCNLLDSGVIECNIK